MFPRPPTLCWGPHRLSQNFGCGALGRPSHRHTLDIGFCQIRRPLVTGAGGVLAAIVSFVVLPFHAFDEGAGLPMVVGMRNLPPKLDPWGVHRPPGPHPALFWGAPSHLPGLRSRGFWEALLLRKPIFMFVVVPSPRGCPGERLDGHLPQ